MSSQPPPIPHIEAILESALYVTELKRAVNFYQTLFGFPEIFVEPGRLHALSVTSRQVLLLFAKGQSEEGTETPGGFIPGHGATGRSHLAFSVRSDELDRWRERLQTQGVEIESEVDGPGGCHSLYVRDLDANLLELISPGCWPVW